MIPFSILLLFPIGIAAENSETIIERFIRNNSDFSKDPCNDFNEHVCPKGKHITYYEEMQIMRSQIVKKHQHEYFSPEIINSIDEVGKHQKDIYNFLLTDDAVELCNMHPNMILAISKFYEVSGRAGPVCTDIINALLGATKSYFAEDRDKLLKTFEEHIILQTYKEADEKVHKVFEKMRYEVSQVFKNTPWIVSKNAVDAYIQKLDAMVFVTLGDFKDNVEKLANDYTEKLKNCTQEIGNEFNATTVKMICEFVATSVLQRDSIIYKTQVGNKNKTIWNFHEKLLNEDGMIFWDRVILLASPLVIIANTTSDSILYGTFGVVLFHEIMHGFIFSENDNVNDLKELWTDNSDCVNRQMEKTCKSFPVFDCPHSNQTFEEDGADMAAYRLAWNMFKKPMTRKSYISSIDQITSDQMFFYGLAVTYCNDYWRNRDTMVHSQAIHRINSLASSLDEFATAFQCKPTDRMVQNKAGDCILYGEKSRLKNQKSREQF